MTRIVAGIAKGRTLAVPARGTRPTTDRVREAIFSAVASRMDLEGARVLDLYAGSGALGLEAASRGATSVVLVDSDRRAARVARANAEALGLPARVVLLAAERVAASLQPEAPFGLVLLDPPYDMPGTHLAEVIEALGMSGNLDPQAVLVLERGAGAAPVPPPLGWSWETAKRYGDTMVQFGRAER
jgi:16S rRNA (guanine966-N2)-methyltransferase